MKTGCEPMITGADRTQLSRWSSLPITRGNLSIPFFTLAANRIDKLLSSCEISFATFFPNSYC